MDDRAIEELCKWHDEQVARLESQDATPGAARAIEMHAKTSVALLEASKPAFRTYAHAVVANAKALADELTACGFDLISGGTDNHLILIDLTNKNVTGKQVAKALDRAGIVVNYNTVPEDPRPPFNPSGIRIGTPAITSRGMTPEDMRTIARLMDRTVTAVAKQSDSDLDTIATEAAELAEGYPTFS